MTATITWLREFAHGCLYTEDERRLLAIADELEHRRAEVADLRSQLRTVKNDSRMMQSKFPHAGPGSVAMEDIDHRRMCNDTSCEAQDFPHDAHEGPFDSGGQPTDSNTEGTN